VRKFRSSGRSVGRAGALAPREAPARHLGRVVAPFRDDHGLNEPGRTSISYHEAAYPVAALPMRGPSPGRAIDRRTRIDPMA
jgi:hypothetical protein